MPGSAFIDMREEWEMHRGHWTSLVPPGHVWRPPLMEHGPELDDRICRKHWKPNEPFGFFFFRFFGKCGECVEDERQEWLEEVRCKFQRGLEAAARGEKVEW